MLEQFFQWYWNLVEESPDVVIAGSFVLALLTSVIMLAMVTLHKPSWFYDKESDLENIEYVRKNWVSHSKISFLLSIIFSGISLILMGVLDVILFAPFVLTSLATVSFIAVFSLLTDPQLRLVDRHILRVGMLITFISSFMSAVVVYSADLGAMVGYFVLLVIITIIGMLPIMGASDSRAVVIVFLSLISVLFSKGLMISWLGSVLIAYGYALKKNNWNIKKSLFTVVSLPLVPMLLFPAATLLTFAAPLIKTGIFF